MAVEAIHRPNRCFVCVNRHFEGFAVTVMGIYLALAAALSVGVYELLNKLSG